MSASPPLIELLGAQWDAGAPVMQVLWDRVGAGVGFALGDGRISIASTAWREGPRIESRGDERGAAVVPASKPAPQPEPVDCAMGSCVSAAADAGGGFLVGGADGHLVQVPGLAPPRAIGRLPSGWVDALACSPQGERAFAGGRLVKRLQAQGSALEDLQAPAAVTALAYSPDGATLAASHHGGVTLWPAAGPARRLVWPGYHRALAWSPDGVYLVTAMQENALHGWRVRDGGDIEMGGYPGQPLSLAFAFDGRYLATSGALRPVCWGFDPPGQAGGPVECGLPSKTPVTAVACHPRQSLIAAGYFNGAVLLCQPGRDEALFIKGAGGAEVTALAWSHDGSRLAFGTQGGGMGWLSLPAALFRAQESAIH